MAYDSIEAKLQTYVKEKLGIDFDVVDYSNLTLLLVETAIGQPF